MDTKRKTCDIRNWKKNVYFSTYSPLKLIHLSRHFTSASKPAVEKSIVSPTSAPRILPVYHHRDICHKYGTALR
jgi:hypothetical protein